MQLVILAFVIFRSCCHSLQHSSHLLNHFPSDAGIQSINQSFFLSWLLPQPAVQLSSISSFIHVLIAFNPSIIILLLLPQPAAQLSFDDTLFH